MELRKVIWSLNFPQSLSRTWYSLHYWLRYRHLRSVISTAGWPLMWYITANAFPDTCMTRLPKSLSSVDFDTGRELFLYSDRVAQAAHHQRWLLHHQYSGNSPPPWVQRLWIPSSLSAHWYLCLAPLILPRCNLLINTDQGGCHKTKTDAQIVSDLPLRYWDCDSMRMTSTEW